jgi:hypothetical protein
MYIPTTCTLVKHAPTSTTKTFLDVSLAGALNAYPKAAADVSDRRCT